MTENGHQRWAEQESPGPVISVARSPLQAGGKISRSAWSVVYSRGVPHVPLRRTFNVCARPPCSAMARWAQHRLGTALSQPASELVETDALRQVEALSHGFKLVGRGLGRAELVICSTGNGSLDGSPILRALRPGAMLALGHLRRRRFASLAQLPWAEAGRCVPHVAGP